MNMITYTPDKTILETKMTEDRLGGLALLHIHRNNPIDLDDAVSRSYKITQEGYNYSNLCTLYMYFYFHIVCMDYSA